MRIMLALLRPHLSLLLTSPNMCLTPNLRISNLLNRGLLVSVGPIEPRNRR